jgi:uncharacterized OB-fold protein
MACELDASRCPRCGLLAVPPEPIGCERCGTPAVELGATTVSSTGAVIGHATVYEHVRPEPATRFEVFAVRTDDGPVVRSLLRGAGPGEVTLDDRVEGAIEADRFAFVAAAVAR